MEKQSNSLSTAPSCCGDRKSTDARFAGTRSEKRAAVGTFYVQIGLPSALAAYDFANRLDWQHLTGGPRFDYPIDYSVAVTRVERPPA